MSLHVRPFLSFRVATLILWLPLVALSLAGREAPSAEADAAPSAPPIESTRERIEAALKKPASFSFEQTPLADAVSQLSKSLGFTIELDLKALEEASVDARTPITFDARQTSLRAALRRMLGRESLASMVKDEFLFITTPERADREHTLRLYDVKDIVALADDPASATDELIDIVTSLIAPPCWADAGGPGSIESYHSLLVVSQTDEVHREVDELLAALRQMSKQSGQPGPEATATVYLGNIGPTRAIEEKLKQVVSVEWQETPLRDAIRELGARYKLPIELDEKALEDASIDRNTPVTRKFSGITLRSALRLLLDSLDLVYVIVDEVLLVTTPEISDAALVTRLYPVADLVSAGEAAVDEGSDEFETLIDLVTASVVPVSWDEAGGPGSIRASRPADVLICSQTEVAHEEIERLLADLRKTLRKQAENAKQTLTAKKRPAALVTKVYVLVEAAPSGPVVDADQLAKEVKTLIADGQWTQGDAFARGVVGRLVVRTTPAVQKKVERLLDDLKVWISPRPNTGSIVPNINGGSTGGGGGGFFNLPEQKE